MTGFTVTAASASASMVRNGSVLIGIATSTTGRTAYGSQRHFLASSLRLTAPALAQVGTKTITIVATSTGGAVRTAAVSLTVH